jgi:hypothetical protein
VGGAPGAPGKGKRYIMIGTLTEVIARIKIGFNGVETPHELKSEGLFNMYY